MTGIARSGDRVTATDTHVLPNGSFTTAPFNGLLQIGLSSSVFVNGRPVAVNGSVAINTPPHPPPIVAVNQGTVVAMRTVTVDGKPVACLNDVVRTCNDPVDLPVGSITSASTDVVVGA